MTTSRDSEALPERRWVILFALLTFALAFLIRTAGISVLNRGGPVGPFDDLYHAYRIVRSAASGRVLSFDPNRGTNGAECPWPPLYDGLAASAARILAGTDPHRVLTTSAWFPPVWEALFAASAAALMGWRYTQPFVGLVAGLALAIAPSSIDVSQYGAIDHHFLEPALLVSIVGSVSLLLRARTPKATLTATLLLALTIVLSLFIQMALLLAAAVACLAILIWGNREANAAAAAAFSLAATAIWLYAVRQPDGYPMDEWHLGIPHAAALVGAAAASATASILLARAAGRPLLVACAVLVGSLSACAVPHAAPALLSGSRFFGGDPWLATIVEFQPLFFAGWSSALSGAARLGAGIVLLLAVTRPSSGSRGYPALLLFAAAYLAAALTSQRFLVCAVTLLALGGAVAVGRCLRAKGWSLALLATALVLLPWLVLLPERVPARVPNFPPEAQPFARAALAIQGRGQGRVLSPWSWGHLFHVIGGKPVLVDGFGASIGRGQFENALGAVLATREDHVADFCRRTQTRWIVLDNPLTHLTVQAQAIGLSPVDFVRPGKPAQILPRTRFSFWWRAYFDRGRAVTEPGRSAPAFREFRMVYADSVMAAAPPHFQGPAVEVWELITPEEASTP